ncbi:MULTISPECIES: molybdate ABC transporter substrate-binding protein [Arthrobacter]|uniref:Molybdate ABC transporter substrate-binding protein n=2 Tax=Arthrobacter TaxID=1663 RepID=A0ABU9KNJ1_9MICC|nr:molybdate ABC transporter substrate-binding protein [Arthrobacter sp. YJM1]MDP5228347.1 molybdate ABC transporter substrate-binding protein [Arthrobacter sp. YJM1]
MRRESVWVKTAVTGVVLGTAMALSACSASGQGAAAGSASPVAKKTVIVFAAASLKATFTQMADDLKKQHPELDIKLNFAGSQDLVAQIKAGAPADVVATADLATMDKLTANGSVDGTPQHFASNTLTIAVPPSNPANIGSLADLAKPGTRTVLCAVQVPCGAASQKVEKAASLTIKPVSEELSVSDVLGKVASGEADAGLVYKTDVQGSKGKVKGVDFPQSSSAVNTYAIGLVKGAPDADGGRLFLSDVTGDSGQAVLAAAGFGKP